MNTLVGHHADQALLIAANAAVDLRGLTIPHQVGPIRVGDELAAHSGALDAAGTELFFHKVGGGETAHSADGQRGERADLVTEG